MSYCFDVSARVWATIREKLPQEARDSEVVMRFEFLLEELHECDHRLRGRINQDNRVTKVARKLDEVFTESRKVAP
jgi:hypothetical protein